MIKETQWTHCQRWQLSRYISLNRRWNNFAIEKIKVHFIKRLPRGISWPILIKNLDLNLLCAYFSLHFKKVCKHVCLHVFLRGIYIYMQESVYLYISGGQRSILGVFLSWSLLCVLTHSFSLKTEFLIKCSNTSWPGRHKFSFSPPLVLGLQLYTTTPERGWEWGSRRWVGFWIELLLFIQQGIDRLRHFSKSSSYL